MSETAWDETLVATEVTYILEIDGEIVVVEGVPARLNIETGERYFAPETVEQLHQILYSSRQPERTIQAPVFRFAA